MSSGDFDRRFRELTQRTFPALLEKGVAKAAMALMRDATMEIPKTPLDESSLRGSGSAFVGSKLVSTSEDQSTGEGVPTPNTEFSVQGPATVVIGTVGFNTPYAARLHEHPEFDFGVTREKRGLPRPVGTGGKFLEEKMSRNRNRYMQIIAKTITGAGGGVV